MWVQKLKLEVGVNSEVEQHSVSFLEDLDFTPLLLKEKKTDPSPLCLDKEGRRLKEEKHFQYQLFLSSGLHKSILSWAGDIRTKV